MLAAVGEDSLFRLGAFGNAGLEHDKGLDLLHLIRVGNADDAAHVDELVCVENILKLTGIDVVAGGYYHALCAALEVDKALVVHHAEIAGVHPCKAVVVLAQSLGGLLGVVYILHHDGGAGDEYLALLAVGQLLVGARLDYLVICIGEGESDAALLGHVRGSQAACRDAFGKAEALADLNFRVVVIQEFVELLFKLDRQTVAAGENALERAEVGVVHARQAQQRFVKRGNAGNEVAVVFGYLLCIGLCGEARNKDASAALREHCVDAYAQTEAMEQRHCREHLVAHAEHGVCRDDLLAEGVEVAV